jgi:hypothetical protein
MATHPTTGNMEETSMKSLLVLLTTTLLCSALPARAHDGSPTLRRIAGPHPVHLVAAPANT